MKRMCATAIASISSGNGPLQRDLDGLVVGNAPRIHRLCRPSDRTCRASPSAPGSPRSPRAHRLAVVPFQPFAQLDQIRAAVIGYRVALGHLRLRLLRRIHAEQRVPDHPAVVRRDRGGGDDRIQHGQVRLRHEAQHARIGRLCNREAGQGRRRDASRSGPQKGPSFHDVPPAPVDCWAKACRVSPVCRKRGKTGQWKTA